MILFIIAFTFGVILLQDSVIPENNKTDPNIRKQIEQIRKESRWR